MEDTLPENESYYTKYTLKSKSITPHDYINM